MKMARHQPFKPWQVAVSFLLAGVLILCAGQWGLSIAISPDGKTLATAGEDAAVWNSPFGR
jgi:hypothetical protein